MKMNHINFKDPDRLNTGLIQTTDNCAGCNKCISACPVFSANIAVDDGDKTVIVIDQNRCVLCGRCMDICTHQARAFVDDTEDFLAYLSQPGKGAEMALVVAPSFFVNYPDTCKQVLGYLSSLGIGKIYSANIGADISAWGYIRQLEAHPEKNYLSQACPVVVNQIEMYEPHLTDHLVPVQGPLLCTAIYLRKYLGHEGPLAFLSPCIAKKQEMLRPENQGLAQYSVTYKRLMEALADIDLASYPEREPEGLGGINGQFSAEGGLTKTLAHYMGEEALGYVEQMEGAQRLAVSLKDYDASLRGDASCLPRLLDMLACEGGCNCGTAARQRRDEGNRMGFQVHKIRKAAETDGLDVKTRRQQLSDRFALLNPDDFAACYQPRPVTGQAVADDEIQRTFRAMLKYTQQDQRLDCASCGYSTCKEMARAIALGYNRVGNCIDYMKKKLLIERSETEIHKHRLEVLQQTGQEGGATVDQLTGFLNRYAYEEMVEKALSRAKTGGSSGYVISLDLDDFMSINKSYGHPCGNALLIEIAAFLRQNFGEVGHVFRIGGDEFSILVENASESAVRQMASLILCRAKEPWALMGIRLYCSVSIGIVPFNIDSESAAEVIKKAEHAVYTVKQMGKSDYLLYEGEMENDAHERLNLIRQLRDAVAGGFHNFQVHYQPWISPEGRIIGAEALLRWRDDMGNPVSPADFIPIAESVGLILPIGEYVLRSAAKQCRRMNDIFPGFRISVNVSPKQMAFPGLYEQYTSILRQLNGGKNTTVLEITESFGLDNMPEQKKLLERFISEGVQVALDDFGTGYSSLSYLYDLPLNLVKIDRSLIRDIDTDENAMHLLTAIADMMHNMGREVCVEGVETESQLVHCLSAGADIIQGYYYYKPMAASDLESLVSTWNLPRAEKL